MDAQFREKLLQLYEGVRVTDVNDAMDAIGLQNVGCMSREIRPLWKDTEWFSHRLYGFALTVRMLPTNETVRADTLEEYEEIRNHWYRNLAPDKFHSLIREGDVIVIDCRTDTDVGFCGSLNTLGWGTAGAHGVVTNGGARDTDELTKLKIPVYHAYIGRGIRPGRIIYDDHQIPVNVGGVLVNPGDFIVADGDGVVCVPIDKAELVGQIARDIQEKDKEIRRRVYKKAGKPFDFTVE